MLALLDGSKNHRSLPFFSINLLASRAGATKRIRLRNWPLLVSALEYTVRVLESTCLELRYSTSEVVSENGLPGLRTASLCASRSCALGSASAWAAQSASTQKKERWDFILSSHMPQRVDDLHARGAPRRPPGRHNRHQREAQRRAQHQARLAPHPHRERYRVDLPGRRPGEARVVDERPERRRQRHAHEQLAYAGSAHADGAQGADLGGALHHRHAHGVAHGEENDRADERRH